MPKKMIPRLILFRPTTLTTLRKLAKRLDVPESHIVRKAVESYVEKEISK